MGFFICVAAEKLPTLKVVQAHMGETMPYIIERMDEQIANKMKGAYKLPKLPGQYWRQNVWCSTSGSFSKSVFTMLTTQMPMEHIVFGSDYPYEELSTATAFVNSLPISQQQRGMIYAANAAQAFGIK